MENKNTQRYVDKIKELLESGRPDQLQIYLQEIHYMDLAEIIRTLSLEEKVKILRNLPTDYSADVLFELDAEDILPLLTRLGPRLSALILQEMSSDDAADLLGALSEDEQEYYLGLMSEGEAEDVAELLAYDEQSAGGIMTTEFVAINEDVMADEAIKYLREIAPDAETVYYVYVVNQANQLVGVLSLRDLIVASPQKRVGDIMSTKVFSVNAYTDQEEVARLVAYYDILAVPVVDNNGKLLGIITIDDVIDVTEQEATEDFHKMGSVGVLNLSLRDARPSLLYRKRVGWLVMLVFANLFAGAAIAYYEATLEATLALVFFLPLIVDSGGNAGSQAATLMVRALATRDVRHGDWLRLWGKEFGVSLALGLTMALAVSGIGVWRGGIEVGIVVAVSMALVVTVGSMIGMLLPLILTKLKLDPATASAPLITSIADVAGVIIYFAIATHLLM